MKFGGTSVEDAAAMERVCEIVRGRLSQKPVVVVSAMARVTDQLVAMGQAAGGGDSESALTMARAMRERHYSTASELLGTGLFTSFHSELENDFNGLDELLRGIAAVGEITPRSTDAVLSFGERLSSKIVAAAFSARGLHSALVDSRACIVTDATHTRAVPLFDEINPRLMTQVRPLVEKGIVPVMGGFIGATLNGTPTTIGRGGSDFSAAIVGGGLAAERIEIWTDVDGMMTTDPRLCPQARRIKEISFDEAAELAYFGAKVLHPATMLPAIQKNIPVHVLNSRNPKNEGTRITARAPHCRNAIKAIAVKKRITIVDLVATRMLMAHGFLRSVFEVFDRHRCPVDMVSTSEVSVSLTIDSNEAIPAIAGDLQKLADVKYAGRKAIICLVGENVRETPGIAGQVFGSIADVNIRMISQGASEINISFVIDEDDVPRAVQKLHQKFFAQVDPAIFE
ncbi:MAG TPA: lysine-sensitive aspartokinase 3 [Terriglobales bacterium]|nr:lysine-sensitive aspartokinase 3 [Terriglobales bacterium]